MLSLLACPILFLCGKKRIKLSLVYAHVSLSGGYLVSTLLQSNVAGLLKAGLLAFDTPRCFVGLSRASSGSDARVGLSDVFYSSNFDVVFKACPNLPPAVRHGFRVVGCLTTRSRFVLTMLRCRVCVRGRRLWVALFTRAVSHSRWLYISPVKR